MSDKCKPSTEFLQYCSQSDPRTCMREHTPPLLRTLSWIPMALRSKSSSLSSGLGPLCLHVGLSHPSSCSSPPDGHFKHVCFTYCSLPEVFNGFFPHSSQVSAQMSTSTVRSFLTALHEIVMNILLPPSSNTAYPNMLIFFTAWKPITIWPAILLRVFIIYII